MFLLGVIFVFICVIFCMIFVYYSGYLPRANPLSLNVLPGKNIAGYWMGVLHGVFFPFTAITSAFSSKIGIYEVHNNGYLYNLGFATPTLANIICSLVKSWLKSIERRLQISDLKEEMQRINKD